MHLVNDASVLALQGDHLLTALPLSRLLMIIYVYITANVPFHLQACYFLSI